MALEIISLPHSKTPQRYMSSAIPSASGSAPPRIVSRASATASKALIAGAKPIVISTDAICLKPKGPGEPANADETVSPPDRPGALFLRRAGIPHVQVES